LDYSIKVYFVGNPLSSLNSPRTYTLLVKTVGLAIAGQQFFVDAGIYDGFRNGMRYTSNNYLRSEGEPLIPRIS